MPMSMKPEWGVVVVVVVPFGDVVAADEVDDVDDVFGRCRC